MVPQEQRLHSFSSPQRDEEQAELSTVEELVKDAIVSTQPAMMVNLRACSAPGGLVPSEKPPMTSQAQPSQPRPTRLFLRQLKASHLGSELGGKNSIALAVGTSSPFTHSKDIASLFLGLCFLFPSIL